LGDKKEEYPEKIIDFENGLFDLIAEVLDGLNHFLAILKELGIKELLEG